MQSDRKRKSRAQQRRELAEEIVALIAASSWDECIEIVIKAIKSGERYERRRHKSCH